ncbi:MAG: hypothetical protein U0235_13750 [Polyangiaceae bacterium]
MRCEKLTIVAYAGFACALAYGCGTPAKKTASLEPVNDDAGAPAEKRARSTPTSWGSVTRVTPPPRRPTDP